MTDKDIEAEELDLLAIPNLSTCGKKTGPFKSNGTFCPITERPYIRKKSEYKAFLRKGR